MCLLMESMVYKTNTEKQQQPPQIYRERERERREWRVEMKMEKKEKKYRERERERENWTQSEWNYGKKNKCKRDSGKLSWRTV